MLDAGTGTRPRRACGPHRASAGRDDGHRLGGTTPSFLRGSRTANVLMIDPMLATAAAPSTRSTCLKEAGARRIQILCIVAAPRALRSSNSVIQTLISTPRSSTRSWTPGSTFVPGSAISAIGSTALYRAVSQAAGGGSATARSEGLCVSFRCGSRDPSDPTRRSRVRGRGTTMNDDQGNASTDNRRHEPAPTGTPGPNEWPTSLTRIGAERDRDPRLPVDELMGRLAFGETVYLLLRENSRAPRSASCSPRSGVVESITA